MARKFNGTSSYLERAGGVIITAPVTLASRVFLADPTKAANGVAIYHTNAMTRLILEWEVPSNGWLAIWNASSGGCYRTVGSTSLYAAVRWHSIVGVWASTAAPALYVDGDSITGTSVSSYGGDFTAANSWTGVGSWKYSGTRYYRSQPVADVAIWSSALSASEARAYCAGISPIFISPQSLLVYWPFESHDFDIWKNRYYLTPYNSPTWYTHPPKSPENYNSFITPRKLSIGNWSSGGTIVENTSSRIIKGGLLRGGILSGKLI